MWRDNLIELKKEKHLSTKQLAELSNLPEKTVARVLSGQTANPYIDTLDRLATALGCTIGDILAGTKTVVGDTNMSTLQEQLNLLTTEHAKVVAERDLAVAEINVLTDKVSTLNAEISLLNMKIMHKDELLALHNYYNKIKSE
jgi:transcriptional regulator with XRE-family HTH domain